MIHNFKLIKKTNLTHNIYEMIFKWDNELKMKPWQFITFLLDKIWGRAYSILFLDWKEIVLIIKKREKKEWGRWWSKFICELSIWDTLKWVWPAWSFLLQENNKNKLFIWTGTGFVPLYNQIIYSLWTNQKTDIKLLFWSREQKDLFYIKELKKLKEKYKNFDFELFLSRSNVEWIKKWYTTDFLNESNCNLFEEFYICWAPTMIDSSIIKLEKLWISKNNIFYEKY